MVCKVSPKVVSPQRGVSTESGDQHLQEATDYETALDMAGYGRFSVSVLCACACAFFTTGVQNCVMSYVLPAARCELALTTYQAGLVNMAFMCGGVASAFFWGIVGDVFGRRNALTFTLLLDSIITLGQSVVTDYRVLLVARCIDGFLIGGPSTLVFPYLSDVVGAKRRQFYLNITGMGFVAAWLILPAIAWLVIPYKLDYSTILPVHSWRLYLALASLPGFIAGVWMWFLPESPRLLSETNRGEKAVKILARIHKSNGSNEEFKLKKLAQHTLLVSKSVDSDGYTTKSLFLGVLRDLRMFVSRAYAFKSSLILFVFFANMAAGFGLNMWIPEMLLRIQGNGCKSHSIVTTENNTIQILEVSRTEHDTRTMYPSAASLRNISESPVSGTHDNCDSHIDAEVFTSGLIVGAACVLVNALCVAASGDARGVRRAACACTAACAAAAALLAAAGCACLAPPKVAVAAAATLNAASLNGNVLLIRLLLHALPPRLGGLGVCWGAWWGRAGGVASNVAVGALLDYSCPAPFLAVAALLAVSIVGIVLIKVDTENLDTKEQTSEENPDKAVGLDRYISTHM